MGVPGGIERGEAGDDDPDSWDYSYNVMGPETLSPGKLELLSPGNLHYGGNFSRMILRDGTENTQTDYIATSQAIAILESRTGQVARDATNKIKLKAQSPFFLAVGLVRPHVPLIAPENCYIPYPDHEMQIPEVIINDDVPEMALKMRNGNIWKMNDLQKKQTISGYMASIRFMDQQVGRLMHTLDRLNLKDNTIVVFISDHGYNLGEHDCWSKVSLWEGSVRVPMIISYPGNKKNHGEICETVTELIDLYPTLTELCGLSDKQPEILQGKSYGRYIMEGKPIEQESIAYTVTNRGNSASIRTKEWRYTRWSDSSEQKNEELYDHVNDPEELENLAYKADYQEELRKMRSLLESYKSKALNN
jgi:arylsulfatase A-like enzyme